MKLSIITTTILLSSTLFIGCGSSDEEKKKDQGEEATKNYTGYFIDSPISGLNYECGSKKALTTDDGKFSCDTMPVIFKIGNYTIGSISELTSDSKIYPQDLLGLDRSNVEDAYLVELTQFLQALDDDHNITQRITITEETRERFGEEDDDNLPPKKKALKEKIPLPNPISAMDHLHKSIKPENYRPADTSDMSKYMGKWVGGGWSWEVRFKQNYGKFVSNLTGIREEKLPFEDKEKNIMSLLVTHHTAFAFNVDENGDIQGTGTITYDLLPNLCGLHALTKNVINPNIQLFDKIFALGGIVSMNTDVNYMTKGVNLDTKIISAAQEAFREANSFASFKGMDWSSIANNTFKEGYMETKGTNDMCGLVSENPKVKGGLSIGPMSLDELLTDASVSMGKAVVDTFFSGDPISAMTGVILNVPGLTQVQYNYKGLQNGPETRTFNMSGHVDNKGQMLLHMDDVRNGGSNNLVVEYTVNYETETPTFPIWSPFFDEQAGTIYPSNRKYVTYDYVNEDVEKTYNAYDSHTGAVTPSTVTVSKPKIISDEKTLEFPMATFQASGTKRNGVEVWHEYEYSWNAYRVEK